MKKKYIVGIVAIILISIIALVGTSFAVFTTTLRGNKKVTIKAGILEVNFSEGDAINLDNVAPVSDSKGQETTPYTFTITNTGNITAYYHVLLKEDAANTLANSYVKMKITGSNGYDSGIVKIGDYGSGTFEIISENELAVDGSVTYNLWIWLDVAADNAAQGKTYKSKIVVESFDRSLLPTVAETLLAGVGENGSINTSDPDQTFITGTDPNNYIWYSGKLWRAVSIDPDDNSVKLVTQWNISAIPYNESGNTAFEGSYMEQWLNDTSVDGFLGNLREPEKFIKTDSVWNATMTEETTKPAETTMVEDTVGLLNIYEYTMGYSGADYSYGYLNNGLYWWTLTPYSTSDVHCFAYDVGADYNSPIYADGVRPSINLKSSVKVVSGDGSENNPYRLEGDNDSNLNGTLLNTRYSGEYIKFGEGENTLYRIVSHETSGLTKITSAEPLKSGGTFVTSAFGSNTTFSSSNTIGTFLNGDYLTSYVGDSYSNMIEESTTWYLGTVGNGDSYRLAKYSTATGNELTTNQTTAQVGLLRFGELMAGQFDRSDNNRGYWTLTPFNTSNVRYVSSDGNGGYDSPAYANGVRPSMNLKSSVIITGGSGTKSDPFVLS